MAAAMAGLGAASASYALVGGLAVFTRTEPRFTRDVDLAVAVDGDRQAQEVASGLLGRGWRVLAQVEQDAVGGLATLRLVPGDDPSGVIVDLLFASSGIEPEIVAAAESLEVFEGAVVPVATVAHLIALKVLSADERTRPKDRADALALLEVLEEGGEVQVRAALDLIGARGFHRGRDLQAHLDAMSALADSLAGVDLPLRPSTPNRWTDSPIEALPESLREHRLHLHFP
jgi:Nucleotidyl transferase AbiEii toxin, Type IV TA system